MNTADYAFITSILSIIISIGALIWNVWQKFIFVKPVLQVTLDISRIMLPNREREVYERTDQRLLNLTVANLGPGVAVLYLCIVKSKRHWWSKAQYGSLNPIHGDVTDADPISLGPFSAGLPAKIDEADVKSFNFPYDKNCFLKESVVRVGINDTYRRNIWCHRKDIRKVMRSYKRDFKLS
jgi:hypothetical protein